MSTSPVPIPYASPESGKCPLCRERPVWKKLLYGHRVCKKCYYKFANRRQLAYLVDAVLFTVPMVFIVRMIVQQLVASPVGEFGAQAILAVFGLTVGSAFIMKDGFSGQSPGKRLAGVQVLDDRTGQPISFGQSFKRNSILLLGHIPYVGQFAALIVVVTIAIQLNKGYRVGDRFAGTRVIWRKYARSPVFGGDGLLCDSCGYELTGNLSGVCPECGTPVSERVRSRAHSEVAQTIV